MKRIIRLTESDLNRIVKRVLREAVAAPEPVKTPGETRFIFFQDEGSYKLSDNMTNLIKNFLRPKIQNSISTLEKFYMQGIRSFPDFIEIGAGTTSGGSYKANASVARMRIKTVVDIVKELFNEFGLNDEVIQRLITTNTDYNYTPTKTDSNFYDRDKLKPKLFDKERYVFIRVNPLTTKGLDKKSIGSLEDALKQAAGWGLNVDEEGIVNAICSLETYSDIVDLNYELRQTGGLQAFINNYITSGLGFLNDDAVERNQIMGCLNSVAKTSGKGKIAAVAGDKLTLIL